MHVGKHAVPNLQICKPPSSGTQLSLRKRSSELIGRRIYLLKKHSFRNGIEQFSFKHFSDNLPTVCRNVKAAAAAESLNYEHFIPKSDNGLAQDVNKLEVSEPRSMAFRNKFLNFVRIGSIINNAAESFFKSEIRRRLFVTSVLLVMSRVGYFIPLPGFDRRLIPENYLSFVSGSVGESFF